MAELGGYLGGAEAARLEALAAPLSVRKALLCAVLVDDLAGRAFAEWRNEPERVFRAEDVLAFRRALRQACPAIGLIAGLCGMRPGAPRLEVRAITVAPAAFAALPVEDYMVSLYNSGTVPRVMLTGPKGERLAQEVLDEAIGWWREQLPDAQRSRDTG